jgi:histone H3/H4
MKPEEFRQAADLDTAWLNFEPDLPLKPDPETAEPHPFYVTRPDNPADRLRRILLRPYHNPPKLFFSGHRGCGKSTELSRLAADPEIRKKYFPIHFSIRDEADINNLDYRDVLLILGAQIYRQYRERGGRLPKDLLKELDSWRGQVEERIQTSLSGRIAEGELDAELDGFFARLGAKVKLEPRTRHELHQVFERNITGLLEVVNNISHAIYGREQRPPLVLIDDLDKPSLEVARRIFYEQREIMLQPTCPIVYTVSSPLFYGPEFQAIRDRAVFLPNIKLHGEGQRAERNKQGYDTLREAVRRRMSPDLIDSQALDQAAEMSGGVFRELMRILRNAIDRALEAGHETVQKSDVDSAAAEIRGEYRRILNSEQRRALARIRATNQLDDPAQVAPLLQLLAVLEYANGEPWYDVHPVLNRLLDEEERPDEPAD